MVPRIGCSTSKVATIFVGIETLSRLSIFRSVGGSRGVQSVQMHRLEIAKYKNSVENISHNSKIFEGFHLALDCKFPSHSSD